MYLTRQSLDCLVFFFPLSPGRPLSCSQGMTEYVCPEISICNLRLATCNQYYNTPSANLS